MGNLHRFGTGVCSSRAFPHQIVAERRAPLGQCFAAAVFVSLAAHNFPAHALDAPDPKDFTDVTLRTGSQLKGRLDQLLKEQPNIRAASRYFEDRKLLPQADGLAEIRFRTTKTKENYGLFFIPFAEEKPVVGQTHLAVSAEGPKGSRVILGTISAEGNESTAKDEGVVVDGKIQPPDQPFLRNWLKCSLVGCAQALSCVLSGPAWPACMCLACGVSVAGCGIVEYLFP
jgi:hypothetical protein